MEPGLAPRPCALCGKKDFLLLLRGRDLQHGTPGSWSLLECRDCGLVSTHPLPSPQQLKEAYPEDYTPYAAFRPRKGTFRQRVRGALLREWHGYPGKKRLFLKIALFPLYLFQVAFASKVIPFRGKGRLLEVGTGAADHLYYLREQGWNVKGVEPDAGSAERARREFGLDVRQGTLDSVSFPPYSFDVVLLEYVFEHLPEPSQALERIYKILDTRGLLVLDVPNISALEFSLFRENWFPLELPRHLFHFSPVTLRRFLESRGFTLLSLRQDPGPKRFLQSLDYAWGRTGLEHVRWLHFLLFPLTFLFALLGKGPTMRAVFRKK